MSFLSKKGWSMRLRAAFLLGLLSVTAEAQVDTNANGMSDLWEKLHNNGQLFPPSFLPSGDPHTLRL